MESAAESTQFTTLKIKIAELSKKYSECLNIFIKQENQELRENVFNWLEEKFKYFIESINEEKNKKENMIEEKNKIRFNEKENKLNILEKDYTKFINAVISKVFDLAKIKLDKTKTLVGQYMDNSKKLKVYENLKDDPQIQFEFLEQLLYQPIEEMNEDELLNDNIDEQKQNSNIDLFK